MQLIGYLCVIQGSNIIYFPYPYVRYQRKKMIKSSTRTTVETECRPELSTTKHNDLPHNSHLRCVFHIETDNISRPGFTIKHQYDAALKSIFEKFGSRSTDFVASIWRANHTWCFSQHVSYIDFWFGFRCKPYSCFTLMYFVNQICTKVCPHTPALLIIIASVYH